MNYFTESPWTLEGYFRLFFPWDDQYQDDDGPKFNSGIVADLARRPVDVYFARVRHYDPQATGAYSIRR